MSTLYELIQSEYKTEYISDKTVNQFELLEKSNQTLITMLQGLKQE